MPTHPMTLTDLAAAKTMRIDPPRNEARVRLRIGFIPMTVVMPDGLLHRSEASIKRGDVYEVDEANMYESEVGPVLRMVETATERDLDMVVRDLCNHVSRSQDPDNPGHRPWLPSFSASFREVMQRSMRPLVFVERLNDDGSATLLAKGDAVAKTLRSTQIVESGDRWRVETDAARPAPEVPAGAAPEATTAETAAPPRARKRSE